jgi:hypothetical protein
MSGTVPLLSTCHHSVRTYNFAINFIVCKFTVRSLMGKREVRTGCWEFMIEHVHSTNLVIRESFTYVIFGIGYMWLYLIFVVWVL